MKNNTNLNTNKLPWEDEYFFDPTMWWHNTCSMKYRISLLHYFKERKNRKSKLVMRKKWANEKEARANSNIELDEKNMRKLVERNKALFGKPDIDYSSGEPVRFYHLKPSKACQLSATRIVDFSMIENIFAPDFSDMMNLIENYPKLKIEFEGYAYKTEVIIDTLRLLNFDKLLKKNMVEEINAWYTFLPLADEHTCDYMKWHYIDVDALPDEDEEIFIDIREEKAKLNMEEVKRYIPDLEIDNTTNNIAYFYGMTCDTLKELILNGIIDPYSSPKSAQLVNYMDKHPNMDLTLEGTVYFPFGRFSFGKLVIHNFDELVATKSKEDINDWYTYFDLTEDLTSEYICF